MAIQSTIRRTTAAVSSHFQVASKWTFVSAAFAILLCAATSFAQVQFSTTQLVRQIRGEGRAEAVGDVALVALAPGGTIPAGSSISVLYSATITNAPGLGNVVISPGNHVCTAADATPGCPDSVTYSGTNSITLSYTDGDSLAAGTSISISGIRQDVSAIASGTITATLLSSGPGGITFSNPFLTVGIIARPALTVTVNPATATVFPCRSSAARFSIDISENLPGALTSKAQETTLSNVPPPSHGSDIEIDIAGIPPGFTLNGIDLDGAYSSPTISGNFNATSFSGAAIENGVAKVIFSPTSSDTGAIEKLRLVFSLTNPNPVAANPGTVTATVQLAPVVTNAHLKLPDELVSFAANTQGTGAVATVSGCSNPIPKIASLSPLSADAGSGGFTLTVNGSNFVSTTQINWNGAARSTLFVNSTQLKASIDPADLVTAGAVSITAVNPPPGGGISNAATFNVVAPNPVPSLNGLSPSSAVIGSSAFTLTVTGSNFVSGSQVQWNGVARPTTFQSTTQLAAVIGAADLASTQTAQITVFNPLPGGGVSGALPFSVVPNTPIIRPGGIVQAASYLPANAPNAGLAPGSFAAAFGTSLATGTAVVGPGQPLPWPTSLLGTHVSVGGIPATVFFVSPTQVDFLIPWKVALGPQPVVITTPTGVAPTVIVNVQRSAPGVFTVSTTGRGLAAAVNIPVSTTSQPSINGFKTAAKRGDYLLLYATGVDVVQDPPPDGQLPDPIHNVATGTVNVVIGGKTVKPDYAGLVGIGLYQLNVKVPVDIPEDCSVAGAVIANGVYSNTFTVAVTDSGDCSTTSAAGAFPPAGARYLVADLASAVADGAATNSFRATAAVAPTNAPPTALAETPGTGGCLLTVDTLPAIPGGTMNSPNSMLDGGTLSLSGPAFAPKAIGQTSKGQWMFPAGAQDQLQIAPGTWTLSGSGGADVGRFGPVNLTLPGSLVVSAFGTSNGVLDRLHDFVPAWTCPTSGDESRVVATISSINDSSSLSARLVCTALCSAGTLNVPANLLLQLVPSSTGKGSMQFTFVPDPATSPNIVAPGLDFGKFEWSQAVSQTGITVR